MTPSNPSPDTGAGTPRPDAEWRGFLIAHARDLHGCTHDFGGDVRPATDPAGLDVRAIVATLPALDDRYDERYRAGYERFRHDVMFSALARLSVADGPGPEETGQ